MSSVHAPLRPVPTGGPDLPAHGGVRVLVADDEETIRLALARFLRQQGHEVEAVASGEAALAALVPGHHALFVCDIRMPGAGGLATLTAALARDPDLAVLVLSGADEAETARQAFLAGAADYLLKPVSLADLRAAIERALHRRDLAAQQRDVERAVREEVAERAVQAERERGTLRDASAQVAESLVTAMEAKDEYFRGRSARIADLAASIASELGLDEDAVDDVRLAGRLHDVGYIGVREEVLRKPGSLTPDEYQEIKEHVRIGLEILSPLRHLQRVLGAVADHHERWDGGGYPRGLAGDAVSLGGRILAAADAWDAVTSARAYRVAMPPGEAIEYLGTRIGTHLDPDVFAAMRTVVERGRALTFIE